VCARDSSAAGDRDAALLTVLFSAGLRRSEAACLDLDDYNTTRRTLTIRGSRTERERVLYAVDGVAEALERWIAVRGDSSGPFFLPVDKGGKVLIRGERLQEQSIYRAVQKRAEQAGVAAFTCQDLRRTFITLLLERGADISTVQRLAGHCSVTTTERYDRHTEKTRRQLGSMLEIPQPAIPQQSGTDQ
jgi:site-specific recombinase XerD